LESLLHALGIGGGQSIFGIKNPMSPICGLLVRLNPFDFGCELVAIRASEPPMKCRRASSGFFQDIDCTPSSPVK